MTSSCNEGRAPANCAASATQYISQAKDHVNQLQDMLKDEIKSKPTAAKLIDEMLAKLTRGLSELECYKAASCPGPTVPGGSVCSNDGKSEVSSGKRNAMSIPVSDGRSGASRRRSRVSPGGNTTTSSSLDDGYTWRKYGQKIIQGSLQSRSYFRCTHKHDQGCQATRQVQRSDDNSSEYKITYIGVHTCQDPSTFHQIIDMPDQNESNNNSFFISFGSKTNNYHSPTKSMISQVAQNQVQMPSPLQSPTTQDCSEEVLSNLTPGSSPADCFMVCDELAPLVGSTYPPIYGRSMHDQTDIISSLRSSPRSLEVGFVPFARLDQDCMQFGFDNEDDDFPLN